jgi:regulator of protease activity HflC (stomatin/prohibitin superfamily)
LHALDWIGWVAESILQLIPRLRLIKSTHAGVRFTRGKAFPLNSGLHVYWPIWSEIKEICVVRQTLDLRYQSLISSDGTGVVVSVTVVYEIDDALKAVTATDNITDTIGDLSQRAVKLVVSSCTTQELKSGLRRQKRSVDRVLLQKITLDVREYGVRVVGAFIADISIPRMIHIISNHH